MASSPSEALRVISALLAVPGLPRVDTLNGSRRQNMKEVRFDAADGVWRFAFAFDPKRRGIIFCGGDKSGGGGKRFTSSLSTRPTPATTPIWRASRNKRRSRRGQMTMRNIDKLRRELSPERRKKIEARAAQLIAEEMTLQQLRHARKLTQVRMAKELGISQDGVSRLEKRSDLLLSTLRKTVEAMGGSLSLIAEFPDRGPVVLAGISGDEQPGPPKGRKPARVHA
jgi:DNA-binding XRE family transcriptional regulator